MRVFFVGVNVVVPVDLDVLAIDTLDVQSDVLVGVDWVLVDSSCPRVL